MKKTLFSFCSIALLFLSLAPGAGAASEAAQQLSENGLLIYGQSGNFAAKWRLFDDAKNSFAPYALTSAGSAVPVNFAIKTSPKKEEALAGYVNANGVLQVLCFDGANWVNEGLEATVGDRGAAKKFDISYETGSGDALVLYSTNSDKGSELAFRKKPGTAGCGSGLWSTETKLSSARIKGKVEWVKMARDRRAGSNLIAAVWADNSSHLSAMIWSGKEWGNEPAKPLETSLEYIKAPQDVDDFDVEYESLSGDVKIVWSSSEGRDGKSGVREVNCLGGKADCQWSEVLTPAVWADDATNLDLAANPETDEMVFASIGRDGSDLQAGYWSGSEWTNVANLDVYAGRPDIGTHLVSAGWLISGPVTRSIISYGNKADVAMSWVVGEKGNFVLQKDFIPAQAFASPTYWREAGVDPIHKDRLMVLLYDADGYLFAKKLTMTNDGQFNWANTEGAENQIGKNIPFKAPNCFAFAYPSFIKAGVVQTLPASAAAKSGRSVIIVIGVAALIIAAGFWVWKKRQNNPKQEE